MNPTHAPRRSWTAAVAAENLREVEEGFWCAQEREWVSYGEESNANCYQVEEQSFWFRHRNACVLAALRRLPPAGPLFDIGGGNGFVSRALEDAGFPTVLVEPGVTGARNARTRGLPNVICGTLASAGFRAESMDAVGLFDVLEHIDNDRAFLRELHRCLKPGGRLYLTVPLYGALWSHDDVTAGHFRRYRVRPFQRLLRETGFETRYATCLFAPLPLPLLLLRSVPSLFGRRALPAASYRELHQPRARSLADPWWACEVRAVARGWRLPFGTSCLAVAEKR